MNITRRSCFSLSLAAGLWVVLAAAASADPMDSVPTLDVVSRKLELTPEQQVKLRPLFDQRLTDLQQTRVRVEQATTKSDKRAVLREARQKAEAFNTSVESALTPSQVNKWQELRAETREKLKQKYQDKHE
jgi:hypothetical protein